MANSNSSQQAEGLVVKALNLDIVIDKILEHLPIRRAAQASVLSKQWRRNWLSLKSLVFNEQFCNEIRNNNEASCTNKDKWSKIICTILLCHKGPIDYFELDKYYEEMETDFISHGHWLSFLSTHGVKKISIDNYNRALNISPYIFYCSKLVHLELNRSILSNPPTGFSGYRNLKHLNLIFIKFAQENFFISLVANCSMLASLRLEHCYGIKHIVIDFPSLQTLIIRYGEVQSIAFRNVRSLECISLSLIYPHLETAELIDTDNLANSCELQSIKFNSSVCKLLAAGESLRSLPVTFNYLNKLCLSELDLSDFDDFHYVLRMLQSCPNVTMLDISLFSFKDADKRELEYNYSHQMAHLVEIKIKEINGSSVELKLIEYLLAVSIVLENLFVKPDDHLDTESRLKMSIALNGFPRASTKARLVFLDK